MPRQAAPTESELDWGRRVIEQALAEDLRDAGDLTSQLLIPPDRPGTMHIVARSWGVIAGLPFAEIVFDRIDSGGRFTRLVDDGSIVEPGTPVAEVKGSTRALLTAERTALNLLTMLGGTATLTRRFVDAVAGTGATILDTRKTFPGLRALQKYAVRCGGGTNHRMGLYDGILIKDNHVAAWRESGGTSLAELVADVRRRAPVGMAIEIEVDTLDQLREVLPGGPSIVLCDNMSLGELRAAVALKQSLSPEVQLEASGGVTLNTVREIAETGVERISVGALTHSAPALDVGCDWR